jgi:hypothetical protein
LQEFTGSIAKPSFNRIEPIVEKLFVAPPSRKRELRELRSVGRSLPGLTQQGMIVYIDRG